MSFLTLESNAREAHNVGAYATLASILEEPVAFEDIYPAISLLNMLFLKSIMLFEEHSEALSIIVRKGYNPKNNNHRALNSVIDRVKYSRNSQIISLELQDTSMQRLSLLLSFYISEDWEYHDYFSLVCIDSKKDLLNFYMNVSNKTFSETLAIAKGEYATILTSSLEESI